MEVQMNREWTWAFRRIDPDHDLSSWLGDWDLYVFNMENGWTLMVVSTYLRLQFKDVSS